MLSFHHFFYLPSDRFPEGVPTRILYALLYGLVLFWKVRRNVTVFELNNSKNFVNLFLSYFHREYYF